MPRWFKSFLCVVSLFVIWCIFTQTATKSWFGEAVSWVMVGANIVFGLVLAYQVMRCED